MSILIRNYKKIPEHFWSVSKGIRVCWFMDRQKPSVEACWDFDEERFGITNEGKIIWGFDSGCSCPCPWEDAHDPYTVKEWKEFLSSPEQAFDADWQDVCYSKMKEILSEMI